MNKNVSIKSVQQRLHTDYTQVKRNNCKHWLQQAVCSKLLCCIVVNLKTVAEFEKIRRYLHPLGEDSVGFFSHTFEFEYACVAIFPPVPITGIRAVWAPFSKSKIYAAKLTDKRIKYEVVKKCCAGYSMNDFGICQPICNMKRCSEFEECIEPNVCRCNRGYAKAMNATTCLPFCAEDCGQHAHCQAPNLCACNEVNVANSSDTTAVGQCQTRCRAGVLWDAMTLECVERQKANVTVIAAEMDLFMPDLDITPLEDIDVGSVEQLDAYIGVAITTSRSLEPTAPKTYSCLTLGHALMVLGVTMFLLTFVAVTLYILKRRQNSYGNVMLEDNHDLPGEYFIDRSQILVY